MFELILIGYWHSDEESEYPDPAWFVDPLWDISERTLVINFLKSGVEFNRYCGYSSCRFRCGIMDSDLGDGELTDGVYYWPEGFVHYVEEHNVKPPEDFLGHVRKNPVINQKKLMKKIGEEYLEVKEGDEIKKKLIRSKIDYSIIQYNKEWWKKQKGHSKGKSFKTPGFAGCLGKLWLIDTNELTYIQIRFLRNSNFLLDYPLSKIKSDLSHKKRILLEEKYEYCHAVDLIREARSQGLKFKIEITDRFKTNSL